MREKEAGREKQRPGEEKEHARDDRTPMRNKEDERIANDGKNVESDESMAMSPAVDEQAAGVGVDRAEKIPQRIEKSDDKNGRAERLEIFRQEAHPQFLPSADGKGGNEQDDQVALEPEELRDALPSVHARSESTMRTRDKAIVAAPGKSELQRQLTRGEARVFMETGHSVTEAILRFQLQVIGKTITEDGVDARDVNAPWDGVILNGNRAVELLVPTERGKELRSDLIFRLNVVGKRVGIPDIRHLKARFEDFRPQLETMPGKADILAEEELPIVADAASRGQRLASFGEQVYGPALAEKPTFHISFGRTPMRPLKVGSSKPRFVRSQDSGREASAAFFTSTA